MDTLSGQFSQSGGRVQLQTLQGHVGEQNRTVHTPAAGNPSFIPPQSGQSLGVATANRFQMLSEPSGN